MEGLINTDSGCLVSIAFLSKASMEKPRELDLILLGNIQIPQAILIPHDLVVSLSDCGTSFEALAASNLGRWANLP